MKKMLAIAAIAANSICLGQYVERVFWLPDSFPELEFVARARQNPVSGRVYLAEWQDWVNIFDPVAFRKHGFLTGIPECQDVEHCAGAHRVCVVDWDGILAGFDDRADTLVYIVDDLDDGPCVAKYHLSRNELYAAGLRVNVFDPADGTLLDTMPLSGYGQRLALDPMRDRLYASTRDEIPVQYFDCASRTPVGTVPGTEYTSDILMHPSGSRLYCLIGEEHTSRQVLKVLDADSALVIDSIPIAISRSWGPFGRIFINRPLNRLYCLGMWDWWQDRAGTDQWTWDTVAVFDLAADTLVRMLGLPDFDQDVRGAAVNQTEGRFYMVCPFIDRTFIVGSGDTIQAVIDQDWPDAVCWDSAHNRVCIAGDNEVMVLDGRTDSVLHVQDYYGTPPRQMHWNQSAERLYVFCNSGIGRVGTSDTIEHWTDFRYLPCSWAYSAEMNRYYVVGDSGDGQYVFVYDCTTDSVLFGFPHLDGNKLTLIPETHMLYAHGDTDHVYDILADSVVAAWTYFPGILRYDPKTATTYGALGNLMARFNARGDSILAWDTLRYGVSDMVADTAAGQLWLRSGYTRNLLVYDCSTRSVVDSVAAVAHPWLAFIAAERKLYAIARDTIDVVSTRERRVTKSITASCSFYGALNEYDGRSNRLYLDCSDGLLILDCHSDSLLALVPDEDYRCMTLNSACRELYGASGKRVAVVKDSTTGIRTRRAASYFGRTVTTVVCGTLPLTGSQDAELHDVTGRKVMDLSPGQNNIRHLAPGVYFLRSADGGARAAVRKLVVQH